MIYREQDISKARVKICSRCIYDERVNAIEFDSDGVCNYCRQVDTLKAQYGTGEDKGQNTLNDIVENIKRKGKRKKYDCVLGVSGGTDSSFMMHWAVENGIRPLAVHYDNTWNSAIATENIRKVTTALGIDLFTHVIDNKESDDIFRSFFKAGVPEIDASTDMALAETLYRAAGKYGVNYVLEGHSFMAEGITPLGKNYFDGKYIKSIHKKYGKLPMKTYPLMTFSRFLYWTIFKRIKRIRPFWYIKYSKEMAQKMLTEKYEWQYYEGHHLENRMAAFYHSYYSPNKFDSDWRNNTLSAQVRNGAKSREEAWKEYNSEPHLEDDLLEYFKKRLNLSDQEFERIMSAEPKSWYEFPTYKKRFEKMRPIFKILADANLVPMSFYLKYCFPSKTN